MILFGIISAKCFQENWENYFKEKTMKSSRRDVLDSNNSPSHSLSARGVLFLQHSRARHFKCFITLHFCLPRNHYIIYALHVRCTPNRIHKNSSHSVIILAAEMKTITQQVEWGNRFKVTPINPAHVSTHDTPKINQDRVRTVSSVQPTKICGRWDLLRI